MLLNLLVAILSTSHSQVQDNAGRELKVSKARIIAHYRWVVDSDLLPVPSNLLQLVLSLGAVVLVYLWDVFSRCCVAMFGASNHLSETDGRKTPGQAYKGVSRAFGRVVFWLVLGPVAVGAGALLWVSSCFPFAQYAWYMQYKEEKKKTKGELSAGWSIVCCGLVVLWCVVVAPIYLLVLWLKATGRAFLPCCREKSGSKAERCAAHAEDGGFGVRSNRKRGRCAHDACNKIPSYGEACGAPVMCVEHAKGYMVNLIWAHSKVTVERLLKRGPRGVGADKLREYLDDPMNDKEVRHDEKDRPTTVEHVKQLRDRLLTTSAKQFEELQTKMEVLTQLVNGLGAGRHQ